MHNRIIDRVNKLIALALDKGATIAEAANAAARARRILSDHGFEAPFIPVRTAEHCICYCSAPAGDLHRDWCPLYVRKHREPLERHIPPQMPFKGN